MTLDRRPDLLDFVALDANDCRVIKKSFCKKRGSDVISMSYCCTIPLWTSWEKSAPFLDKPGYPRYSSLFLYVWCWRIFYCNAPGGSTQACSGACRTLDHGRWSQDQPGQGQGLVHCDHLPQFGRSRGGSDTTNRRTPQTGGHQRARCRFNDYSVCARLA